MPITLYPPLPISLARFSEHIDFLQSATAQIVEGSLGIGVRPLAASTDFQLASLARYHGERIYRDLTAWDGGKHESHLQRLRQWALGGRVDLAAFRETLDHFEQALTDPHESFDREIFSAGAPPFLSTRLLDFLKGECVIEHGNRVFHVNGVAVDPLLDQDPLPEVFSFLETVTDKGSRFTIPSLRLAVSADPTSDISDLNDLLARVETGTVAAFLLEEVLYVVSREKINAGIAPKIGDAVKNHFLVPIRPIEQSTERVNPRRDPLHPDLWNDPMELGTLNLQDIVTACQRRWRQGLDIPSIGELSEIPALNACLGRNAAMLDWSDLKKIRIEADWLWDCVFQGRISDGQWATGAKRLQGILGELSWREKIISEFVALPTHPDPSFSPLLVLEGQLATADGKRTSDAVLGWLNPHTRRLTIHKVIEMIVSDSHIAEAQEQHKTNETRRFPERGVILLGSDGSWGRVFPEGKAVQETWKLSGERHKDIREDALIILKQFLVWMSLKRATATVVPTTKRRQLASHSEKNAAAKLLRNTLAELWRSIEHTRDIRWLDLQLSGFIRTSSGAFAQMLGVYQAGLRNVSVDLNLTGERKPATHVATATGVTSTTAGKYQDEAAVALLHLGLSVLKDDREGVGKRASARREVGNQLDDLWKNAHSPGEVLQKIEASAALTTASEELKEQLARYRATFENISVDLNTTGQRLGGNEMSRRYRMPVSSYRDFKEDIEERMAEKKWKILTDPGAEQSKITKAAQHAHEVIEDCWSKAGSARELDEMLQKRSKTLPEETRIKIDAYRLLLRDMSQELNASGKRSGLESLAEGTDAAYVTLHKYGKDIEERFNARSWALLASARPQASASRKASEKRQQAVDTSWRGEESVQPVLEKLNRSAELSADETERRHILAYVTVMKEMSAELNPSGVRTSSEKLAESLGVSPTLVYASREDIELRLTQMGSPVVADPFSARSRQAAAAHQAKTIWESVVEKSANEEQMARALDAQISASSDSDLKTYLAYYRDTLFNISVMLNSNGHRISPFELGRKIGAKQQTMIDYESKVEDVLNTKGWQTLSRTRRR